MAEEEEGRRIAALTVDSRLLVAALGFPEGTQIIGAEWDWAARQTRLYIESPKLAPVRDGDRAPDIVAAVHVETDENGRERYTVLLPEGSSAAKLLLGTPG
jgi:hypothetical protein